LDFYGVKLVTPSFYATSVGDLQSSRPSAFIDGRITISDLSSP